MKKPPQRLCIYPKEIVRITGKSERFSRSLIHRICQKLGKEEHQFITTEEFCHYTGFDIERVKETLKD